MDVALSPLEFARRSRRLYPNKIAVVADDHRWTYEQFLDRCDRWSGVLQDYGVQQGDRVATIAPNTHSHLEAFYAIPQIGAVIVPINYRLIGEEIEYIINHSGAKVVCVHSDYLDLVDEIRANLPNVSHFVAFEGSKEGWINYEETLTAHAPTFNKPTINENDLLSINYTSGTTARPKGVMITHRNAYMNVVGTLIHQHLTPSTSYLWTLPMFHANGWTFVWTITACGGKHVCLPKIDVTTIFRLMRDEQVTFFCAAPTVLIMIVHAPEELRSMAPRGISLFTAGAPPAAATIERVEDELGWNITHVYGLTETAPFITICEPRAEHDELQMHERALIKARQGVELITSGELLVIDDHEKEVAWDGKTLGEIVVKGNVVMHGYYNDPEATARAFQGGYFHSGDAAVVHPDGYIEIRDRFKDVIISGGENISSIEVESVLLRHPAVQEVAVVGMPHERWGEAPHAFVVLRQGANASEDELREFAREHMAHFKVPKWFSIISELPKTATGKIQKYVLRGRKAGISTQ